MVYQRGLNRMLLQGLLALCLCSCQAQKDRDPIGDPVGVAPMIKVFEDFQGDEVIGLFAKATVGAGSIPTLNSVKDLDQVSVFAPSNEAIHKYLSQQQISEAQFLAKPPSELAKFVVGHIVGDKANDSDSEQQTTLAGTVLTVSFNDPRCKSGEITDPCFLLINGSVKSLGGWDINQAAFRNKVQLVWNGLPYMQGNGAIAVINGVLVQP